MLLGNKFAWNSTYKALWKRENILLLFYIFALFTWSYFTSSTPSIHLGESLLVTPMPASGSKPIPDTKAIRSSTSYK